ncbi:MAG: hypothetical protein JST30_11410 [Armatimonadetes bacterium]|nr:hypothetical protein [Armatimonadota bacterium]
MPMKARYTVVDGEVVSEVRGGVRKDFVPDPLGSTVALLDNAQSVTDSWEYWPYGELRSGSSATPFQYVGTLGYYKDTSRRTYVRARHYRQNLGRWMTVDPIWPKESAYIYASAMPQAFSDFTGLSAQIGLILYIAKCEGICESLERGHLDEMDRTGGAPVGETICCCGSPYVCVYAGVLKKGLGHKPPSFILECIAKHELWHARNTATCNGRPDGPTNSDGNPRECEAHMISYSCAINSKSKCKRAANPAQCESDVDVFLRSECIFFKRNNCPIPKECARYGIR